VLAQKQILQDDEYRKARDRLREAIDKALTTDEQGNPLGGRLVPAGRIYLDRTAAFNGRRLRAMRKKRKMKVTALAQRAGLTARHLWRLEAGQRPNVRAVTLARLALALRVDLYYLLGLSDEPEPWKNKVRVDRSQDDPAR
jgi:DNA-binding Xre family transcriptional regulator